MTKINLKIYHPAHLNLFELADYQGDVESLKGNTEIIYSENDEAYTVMIDDKIVFAIGARILRKGVAECWIIRSKYTTEYKKNVVQITEKLIQAFSKDNNIRRWQSLISPAFVKWIEFMNFEKESELVGFDEETKYYMYRRLM